MVHSRWNRIAGRTIIVVAAALLSVNATQQASAKDPSEAPVGVRWWGNDHLSVETWWGLTVAVNPDDSTDSGTEADLIVTTTKGGESATGRENSFVVSAVQRDGDVREFDLVLDRLPNDTAVTLTEANESGRRGPHPVQVSAFPASTQSESEPLVLIEADGVRVLYGGALRTPNLSDATLNRVAGVDVLIVPIDASGKNGLTPAGAAELVVQVSPAQVAPMAARDRAGIETFVRALGVTQAHKAVGNTLAATGAVDAAGPTVHLLKSDAWTPPARIQEGLAALRNARASFESVVTTLSAEQLDHIPSNGTHTVRWNAEHTAGAELYFFSFVFKDANDSFPIIRATPAQQPSDYVAGNPDWSPMEEAAHLQRTGEFVERFAYMLDGVNPDEERYPTFFKSLDGLFTLLEGHYGKHQQNVEAKFSLADWPKN